MKTLIEMIKTLKKHVAAAIIIGFGALITLIAELVKVNNLTLVFQIFGWIFLFVIWVVFIICKKNFKEIISKTIGISIPWLVASCIFVTKPETVNFVTVFGLILQIYTIWEYVLIGCVAQDFYEMVKENRVKPE